MANSKLYVSMDRPQKDTSQRHPPPTNPLEDRHVMNLNTRRRHLRHVFSDLQREVIGTDGEANGSPRRTRYDIHIGCLDDCEFSSGLSSERQDH
jgi:hypothetical protein